jgi:HEAT repeat protein
MRFSLFVALIVLHGWSSLARSADRPPIAPSFLMDEEPAERPQFPVIYLNPEMLTLWKQTITHPESELQRQTAEAICKAFQSGHKEVSALEPELIALLKQKKIHPATRYAAAHALIALNSRDSAATLFETSQRDGKGFRQLVEPTLADWGFEPIHAIWLERIKSPTTPRRELQLAIRGLSQNRVVAAHADLLQIALSSTRPSDIRLAAARAAADTAETGLEPSTKQLLSRASRTVIDRLCAAALLGHHRSEESITLNQSLAVDAEPTVAGMALRTLFAIGPQLVLPVAEVSLKSPDANVRRVAIDTYVQLPTVERLETLSAFLSDPHPELRGLVREGFFTHASRNEFEPVIRESSIRVLGGDDWRGQEQAALLLAALDRKEIAPRLLELMKSDRDEVMIATAWALRVLAVPETATSMIEQIQYQSQFQTSTLRGADYQVAHLSEALGVLRNKSSVPVLRIYVPKTMKYGPISRAAAIWALGQIFEDAAGTPATPPEKSPVAQAAEALGIAAKDDSQLPEELAAQFMGRVREIAGMPPEFPEVRRTSALALGRMKATSQLGGLKEMIGVQVDSEAVELAMRWAVLRITGEDLPIAPPARVEHGGWFIEPAPTSIKVAPPAPVVAPN